MGSAMRAASLVVVEPVRLSGFVVIQAWHPAAVDTSAEVPTWVPIYCSGQDWRGEYRPFSLGRTTCGRSPPNEASVGIN